VEARFTSTIVEVYYKRRRLLSHPRRYGGQLSTVAEHMPSSHRAHAEWTPSRDGQTLDKMNAMKLTGMTEALRQQIGSAPHTKLSFDERFGLLVDAEWLAREQKSLKTRPHAAKLRYPASLEDVDFKHPRGLDRQGRAQPG